MLRKHSAIFLLTALSLVLPALSAADTGQYVIVSAQYGNLRSHIDVTSRLKELASKDVRFKLDYRTFGDPAPGQAKTLRIYARGPNGRQQVFEYPDNAIVDGSQFRAWGSGRWGGPNERWNGDWNGGGPDVGQYLILSAQYGNSFRHIDVTNQLRQLARTNQQYRVDYLTFGDPAQGQAKSLRIYARGPGGRQQMFEYPDNSVVDGAQFRGWGSGQWAGANDRWNGKW
jgi:hypothetical protein